MNIPYFRPEIGEEEQQAVVQALASGWLTSGRVVREFESEFAAFVGARHAVAVNSCTAALHLAYEAAGIGPGDLVLVPTLTFSATAAAVRYLGARPVLVDCEAETLCVDPDAVEAAAARWSERGRLAGIVAMHYGGQPADIERLAATARRYGATLIEDAAHALPAATRFAGETEWRSIGSISPLTCFSFYANKCITTGEGGMATTDDPELADRMRKMSLHGLSRAAWKRFEAKGSWYYEIEELGFKYNLTDLAAALGRVQLRRAEEFARRRASVAARYTERLSAIADLVETPVVREDRRTSWHIYPLRLRLDRLDIDRAEFIEALNERGVTPSVHWMPLHLHPNYERVYGYRPNDFPVAAREWRRLVSLPLFPGLTDSEVDYVCDAVEDVARANARRALAAAV